MGTAARPDYEGLLALVMHKKLPERQELPLSLGVAPEVLPPSKPPESTWVPSVLVIGGPLPDLDRQRLEKRGCQVEVVPDFVEGLKRMDEGRWDVVVVHPHVQADADGLKFVRQFKHLRPEDLPEEFKSVCSRYKHTPFVILPVPETSQFAIFRTSDDWTLADVNKASIAEAILNARTLGHVAERGRVEGVFWGMAEPTTLRTDSPRTTDSNFWPLQLRLAEICKAQGDSGAAIEIYMKVAREFRSQGLLLKTMEFYEKVLELDETCREARTLLLDVCHQLGLEPPKKWR